MSAQVFAKFDSENVLTLDESVLRSILLSSDEIKDKYVSVISIIGGFRQGKSFLMNFLLRYLNVTSKGKRDIKSWLHPEDGCVQGFPIKSGSKALTQGIQIWSEVFLMKTSAGEEIAVILIDTQGCFDPKDTLGDADDIFAFTTLLSSVQVYNIMRIISSREINFLTCLSKYPLLFNSEQFTSCQKLWLLVRDFTSLDIEGSEYLEELLGDSTEIKEMFYAISQNFEEYNCFVLPPPGKPVQTSNNFVGDLKDVDKDFKEKVVKFVSEILAPENLICKTIKGKKITVEEFVHFVGVYATALKSGTLPNLTPPMTKRNSEAICNEARQKAFEKYEKRMDHEVIYAHEAPPSYQCSNFHRRIKGVVMEEFRSQCEGVDMDIFRKHELQLERLIERKYPDYVRYCEDAEESRKLKEQIKQHKEKQQQQRRAQNNNQGQMGNIDGGDIAKAAVVIGGAAALLFGAFKLFGSNNRNE